MTGYLDNSNKSNQTSPLQRQALSSQRGIAYSCHTAGATDGFSLAPDSQKGVQDFVEKVVPILQERGVFHQDYEGDTLREHLGVPYQYGVRK
ncbi:hypothetical protein PTQ27_00335 [Mannheimia sp. AT1]|uniref:Uncharacterized protein n=1 Tax=Mannheimia cairinae TaxID=3025936 RepID=A0ABT5ML59_9PAST|nr:hypothetical protein [Mannheimia cairinae]MDD0822925.1 hypothetical protein [Mannheimia cairinae]MDD0826047.1 hypothetical protein [Mannheimia cairinae]